jgi:hypothetical protein
MAVIGAIRLARLAPFAALPALWGCADDPCDGFCAAAQRRVESCLEERGLSYTDAGYTDAADWRNFCGTWVWTQGVLQSTEIACIEGWQALEGSCEDVDAIW